MKAKVLLVVGIAVLLIAMAGLAGCSEAGVAAASDTQQPLSVNVNNGQQGIIVNGEGKVSVTPDIAVIYLGVSAEAPKVADAQSQAAAAMDKIMSVLTGYGIDKKDIQTQSYSIQQVTRNVGYGMAVPPDIGTKPMIPPTPPATEAVVTGYQVSNMLVVKVRAVEKTGTILDAAAEAGGDLVRVNGVNFSVDQPEKYYSQARTLAVNDAKAKAAALAELAGVTLGKATFVSENPYSSPGPYPVYRANMASGAAYSTPINPGQSDIVLNVQVNFAIQ